MKTEITIFLLFIGFVSFGQTQQDSDIIKLINNIRINPKSFIPNVIAYIDTEKEIINQEQQTIKYENSMFIGDDSIIAKNTCILNKNIEYIKGNISSANNLISFLRNQKSVNSFKESDQLNKIAKQHAIYIDSIKTLTHSGPNGETVAKRFSDCFILCGENCSMGKSASITLLYLLMDRGNTTKGHRKNIFSTEFTKIGVGCSNEYFVEDFGI